MSDGNYNRNLLPYQNYQSGLRAGKAVACTKAYEVLAQILQTHQIPSELSEELMAAFRTKLSQSV